MNRIEIEKQTGTLVNIDGLKTYFYTERGIVKAVDGLDLSLNRREAVGLVGESGCGKSVTALSLLRLVRPPGRTISGRILFDGHDLLKFSEKQMRELRGRSMAMIFQDPQSTLNPVRPVGLQVKEALLAHRRRNRPRRGGAKSLSYRDRVIDLMRMVHIPSPHIRYRQYPFELSGGMCQRIVIASGLANDPQLLIADEPTTALDATMEIQILDILREIKDISGSSLLLITHNLKAVGYLCDRVAVMYPGKIVEIGLVKDVFDVPQHPYTRGLFECLPRITPKKRLRPIPGEVPDPLSLPSGCSFQSRCRQAFELCRLKAPAMKHVRTGWNVRCHLSGSETVMTNERTGTGQYDDLSERKTEIAREGMKTRR